MKPSEVIILGIKYKIEYVNNTSDVDPMKRRALWGHIDYWNRTIRIYDKERNTDDIWHTLIHEVLHGIADALKLKLNDEEMHDELDVLALAIMDVLFRNNWIKAE